MSIHNCVLWREQKYKYLSGTPLTYSCVLMLFAFLVLFNSLFRLFETSINK